MNSVAILDDWQNCGLKSADWKSIPNAKVVAFTKPIKGEDELVKQLATFDVIVAMRERTKFPASLLRRLSPKLKLLVTTGMRNRAIDLNAAKANNILVCGTSLPSHTTVEHTWALIMALTRQIIPEDRAMHADGWQAALGIDLKGKTLGILGLGYLGQAVARAGQTFGMKIIAWSQNLTPEKASKYGATYVDKNTLLSQSDILTIHTVLSDRTQNLISTQELSLMKPTAYLVNTSRGPIVNEQALIEVLRKGTIAGAALDVFDEEPLPPGHPLRSFEKVILTGHMGYLSQDFFKFVYSEAVEDILSWIKGKNVRVISGESKL